MILTDERVNTRFRVVGSAATPPVGTFILRTLNQVVRSSYKIVFGMLTVTCLPVVMTTPFLDPSIADHETARYLLETMAGPLQAFNEAEIADQLLQARQKKTSVGKISMRSTETQPVSLEDLVTEAITALLGISQQI